MDEQEDFLDGAEEFDDYELLQVETVEESSPTPMFKLKCKECDLAFGIYMFYLLLRFLTLQQQLLFLSYR